MLSANAEEFPAAHTIESRKKNAPQNGKRASRGVWLGLCAILTLYVWSAWRIGPVSNFGVWNDDALYFSSAKALSEGRGYIWPSFPFHFRATEYPELYPLILSAIWKLDPHFPQNVTLAAGLTLAFGCAALVFVFLLFRQWPGLGDWGALGVVGLCALTGYFLWLSVSVMSDIPFMASLLGAIWLAESGSCGYAPNGKSSGVPKRAAGMGSRPLAMLCAGGLAGLSIGFRTLGAAVVAGMGLTLLMRREYRQLVWFSLAAAPVSLLMIWPQLAALLYPSLAVPVAGPGSSGWSRTLCYFTSYACIWRLNSSGPGAQIAMASVNLKGAIEQPGLYILTPLAVGRRIGDLVLVGLLSAAAYVGISRQAVGFGKRPLAVLPLTLFLYLLVTVPYAGTPERYLVPFLPLFLAGVWVEGKRLLHLALEKLKSGPAFAERVLAGALVLSCLALVATVAVNYALSIPSGVAEIAIRNRRLLADQTGAFSWIRDHASPKARIVADLYGRTYLYTGRPTVLAEETRMQAFYLNDPRYAEGDAAHLADVARHINADYWLVGPYDFLFESHAGTAILRAREKQLLAGSPVVFQSADGAVRLYDVRCLFAKPNGACVGDYGASLGERRMQLAPTGLGVR